MQFPLVPTLMGVFTILCAIVNILFVDEFADSLTLDTISVHGALILFCLLLSFGPRTFKVISLFLLLTFEGSWIFPALRILANYFDYISTINHYVQIGSFVVFLISYLFFLHLWFVVKPYEIESQFGDMGAEIEEIPEEVEDLPLTAYNNTIPNTRPYKIQQGRQQRDYQPWRHGDQTIDRRQDAIVEFNQIPYRQPTYLVYSLRPKYGRRRNLLICKEVFWEAFRLISRIIKLEEVNEQCIDTIKARMSLKRDLFNLSADEEMVFNDSILVAVTTYKQYLGNRSEIINEAKIITTTIGLLTGSYGRFYKRLFRRALNSSEKERLDKITKCMAAAGTTFIISTAFGYIWRQIPKQYQNKNMDGPSLLPRLKFFGDNSTSQVSFSALKYFNPKPDISNVDNLIAGRECRLNNATNEGVNIGKPTAQAISEIKQVVQEDLKNWASVSLMSLRQWLNTTSYSASKKEQIMREVEDPSSVRDTMFVKNESYTEFKAPRVISNSLKQEVAIEGPVVKSAEIQFDQLPSVLSGKPVSSWGKIVSESLGPYEKSGWKILVTDHSSFESSVSNAVKDIIENPIYKQILKDYPEVYEHITERQKLRSFHKTTTNRTTGERIHINYKYDGRNSGDARTYQANTLTNHYLIAALQKHFNYTAPYFVSGDDGLMAVPINVSLDEVKKFFSDCGFKTDVAPTTIERSGFCGFTFDPENGNRRLSEDVVTTIINFFSAPRSYNMSHYKNYIYDKAICLLHEYVADPVLRPALEYILGKKRRYQMLRYRTDWWDRYLVEQDLDSVNELLQIKSSSFDFANTIHKSNLTVVEEMELSKLVLEQARAIYENKPYSGLKDWLYKYDIENRNVSRLIYNEMQDVETKSGLYDWSPEAYNNLFHL